MKKTKLSTKLKLLDSLNDYVQVRITLDDPLFSFEEEKILSEFYRFINYADSIINNRHCIAVKRIIGAPKND